MLIYLRTEDSNKMYCQSSKLDGFPGFQPADY